MNDLDSGSLDESLQLLGDLLDAKQTESVHLVVVGGAALMNHNLVTRTTKDIDVLALREIPEGAIVPIHRLPDGVREAARQVGEELDLAGNWLNATTALFSIPLESYPPEIWSDMSIRRYGTRLEVSFLGRTGLIYLKFYAAIDPERTRKKEDRGDLQRLAPTREEAEKAIRWMLREELVASPRIPELRETLQLLGHEELLSIIE